MKYFKQTLWKRYPESFNTPPQGMDMVDLVDRLLECYDLEVALQLTKYLLKEMGLTNQVYYLTDLCTQNEVRYELRMNLKKRYSNVYEGSAMQGEKKAFDSVFTDLSLTSKGNFGPNIQHEVRQIEKLNTHRKPEELVAIDDILNTKMIENNYVKCLLTTGIGGMGKSMAVQKFIMDWAEERAHQNVYYLFPLPFRELNRFLGKEISFLDILYYFFPEIKKLKDLTCDEGRVLFIFDGLDEYQEKLEFHRIESWSDETTSTSLHVLVCNLLKGNIIFRSLHWITSRPLRSHVLPPESVNQVMDGRGFNDTQKEDYFRKRFDDPVQADRVIAHLTSCKTLHIMCHIPLFCLVVCGTFQEAFRECGPEAELPKGLTKMYTQLLLVLLHLRTFRVPNQDLEKDFLFKMGKMAFHMLEKGQITISKETWNESGVEKEEAVVNTGLCTEFLVEKFIMYQEKVQCFIHPTMQEYMAALYVYLSYRNLGKNVLEQQMRGKFPRIFKDRSMLDLFKSAVDRTLQSDGTYDLFLRFLLGMSLKTNQELLQPFFTTSEKWTSCIKETTALIRKRILANDHPDRNANLLLSLEELGV
ncbi:protein NLRC3 [Aplochiton taeniatus]